jgi:radical SAM/Cys-rich protein
LHNSLPALEKIAFPNLSRTRLSTLQVNLGYLCNQSCLHCHVNAGPKRKELMSSETIEQVLRFIRANQIELLDLTGGAPEMNPHFRYLVEQAVALGVTVIDRCNLTIAEQPGYEDLPEFLARHGVMVTASLPCYLQDNVDSQRGEGVFAASIRVLQRFNALGYGKEQTGLELNLVYNPQGASLPPPQSTLEQEYKRHLQQEYGISFNRLLTIVNMPINRFGSTLISKGLFDDYMGLLMASHQDENLEQVMCRSTLSVDWQGRLFDCDFNQMLGLGIRNNDQQALSIADLNAEQLGQRPIEVRGHCYGCTAGAGSSCSGALTGK